MTTDAVLEVDPETEFYDMQIGPDGDILAEDFFDTSILYSLFGERRASADEVVEPQRRRGWIGNEAGGFENGSKIWLYEQARLTRSTLNGIEDEAAKALQWLVDDGYAVSIDSPVAIVRSGRVLLEVTIRRSRDRVSRRFYELWERTGRAS